MEFAVSSFFINQGKEDPTKNFGWDYILVDNDKIVNAWCMPGGKIAVYTGLLKVTKNIDALSMLYFDLKVYNSDPIISALSKIESLFEISQESTSTSERVSGSTTA